MLNIRIEHKAKKPVKGIDQNVFEITEKT